MEFWGVEVKPGETLPCVPGEDKYLHLSQAAIGETKDSKGSERVSLYVHIDGKKLMLGTLSRGNCDQISLDLVFEKEFKLSHNLQSGSVFYCGYSTVIPDEEYEGLDGEDSESEDDELTPAMIPVKENGKPGAGGAKPAKSESKPAKLEAAASGKVSPKVKPAVKKDEDKKDEDEDEDDEDEDDEEMVDLSDESDDEDEEDESEDESEEDKGQGTPKVETAGKKRLLPDSATKSSGTEKKAKLVTPAGDDKTGLGEGKKVRHVPTPHPAKRPAKPAETPAGGVKQGTPVGKGTPGGSKQNTSGSKGAPKPNATQGSEKKPGQFVCQICSRSFTTEPGLNSHNAAKHAGGK